MKYVRIVIEDMDVVQVNDFSEATIDAVCKLGAEVTMLSNISGDKVMKIREHPVEIGDYIARIDNMHGAGIRVIKKSFFEKTFRPVE